VFDPVIFRSERSSSSKIILSYFGKNVSRY
jgi:hypothetical protein